MAEIRRAGTRLAAEGRIDVTQKGDAVPPDAPGPIRYRLARTAKHKSER
jgi:hypothetical protein